jgi:hypothetical protein
MRYVGVPTITFVDATGKARTALEMRELPTYETSAIVARTVAEPFDALACRSDVYGPESETMSYKLHEAMAEVITDHRFDYSIIRSVRVPR